MWHPSSKQHNDTSEEEEEEEKTKMAMGGRSKNGIGTKANRYNNNDHAEIQYVISFLGPFHPTQYVRNPNND